MGIFICDLSSLAFYNCKDCLYAKCNVLIFKLGDKEDFSSGFIGRLMNIHSLYGWCGQISIKYLTKMHVGARVCG